MPRYRNLRLVRIKRFVGLDIRANALCSKSTADCGGWLFRAYSIFAGVQAAGWPSLGGLTGFSPSNRAEIRLFIELAIFSTVHILLLARFLK